MNNKNKNFYSSYIQWKFYLAATLVGLVLTLITNILFYFFICSPYLYTSIIFFTTFIITYLSISNIFKLKRKCKGFWYCKWKHKRRNSSSKKKFIRRPYWSITRLSTTRRTYKRTNYVFIRSIYSILNYIRVGDMFKFLLFLSVINLKRYVNKINTNIIHHELKYSNWLFEHYIPEFEQDKLRKIFDLSNDLREEEQQHENLLQQQEELLQQNLQSNEKQQDNEAENNNLSKEILEENEILYKDKVNMDDITGTSTGYYSLLKQIC